MVCLWEDFMKFSKTVSVAFLATTLGMAGAAFEVIDDKGGETYFENQQRAVNPYIINFSYGRNGASFHWNYVRLLCQ